MRALEILSEEFHCHSAEDLCLMLVRALRELNGFTVPACSLQGSLCSTAHGPGPHFSALQVSVPAPATVQQGWSPALYSPV